MQKPYIDQSSASNCGRPPPSTRINSAGRKPHQKKGIARPISTNRVTKQTDSRANFRHMQKQLIQRLEPLLAPIPAGQADLLADFTYAGDRYIDPETPMRSVSLALLMDSKWYHVQKIPHWQKPQTYSKLEFRFKLHLLKNSSDYKVTSIDTVKVYLSTATPNDEPAQGRLYRWRL